MVIQIFVLLLNLLFEVMKQAIVWFSIVSTILTHKALTDGLERGGT